MSVVTALAYPHGVRCANCRRVIRNGEEYKLRDSVTGKLSTGPCVEDRADVICCADC